MPLTPKKSLVENDPLAKRLCEILDSSDVQIGGQAALLQSLMELPETTDPVVAAAAYHRIVGARQFLNQLLSIAEKAKPMQKPAFSFNLDHTA